MKRKKNKRGSPTRCNRTDPKCFWVAGAVCFGPVQWWHHSNRFGGLGSARLFVAIWRRPACLPGCCA